MTHISKPMATDMIFLSFSFSDSMVMHDLVFLRFSWLDSAQEGNRFFHSRRTGIYYALKL